MQPFRLAIGLGAVLALGSSLALAAPGHPPPHPAWQKVPVGAPPQQHPSAGRHPTPHVKPGPAAQPPQHRRAVQPPRPRQPRPHSPPPRDFHPVHVQVHANRHYIGRGPALPPHVHIVRGKPLPPGWGRPLSHRQHRHVPRYHGYEWRRAGSDLVLVALATGIVHEILHEVLR